MTVTARPPRTCAARPRQGRALQGFQGLRWQAAINARFEYQNLVDKGSGGQTGPCGLGNAGLALNTRREGITAMDRA